MSSSCTKLICFRSSRGLKVNPRFVSWKAWKGRPWINDSADSVTFPVRRCDNSFINFQSYSDRRHKDSTEDTSERNPWKALSLAGAVLFAFAQSRSDSNFFSNWFTVHAAKPVTSDINEYNDRFVQSRPLDKPIRESTNNTNNNNYEKKLSRRIQFNFIADVVESTAKAVVCIQVKDHSMLDWFGGAPRTCSSGSGFIIGEDGLIVTNAHVVNSRERSSIAVELHDGRTFSGRVEAVDPQSDLALIRISAKGLPVLRLGCSSETRMGEWVAAIGAPLSLSNSVTAGVVSSVSRGASELGINNNISYLQTDAAITFGNSGGPLVNLDGEAIGINSMKIAPGISFAIPIDYVKKFIAVVDRRRKTGQALPFRRYMGLTLVTLTDDIILDLEQRGGFCGVKQGVFVWKVVVGSPAYIAGILPGDIIVKINDKDILTAKDVYDVLEVAHTLHVIVMRGTKKYKCVLHPQDVVQ